MNELRERIAAYIHDCSWSGWMRYEFSKCEKQADGSMIIPPWAVERWARQMNTPYNELPENEKETDRKEANKMLAAVIAAGILEERHELWEELAKR